MIHKSDLEHEFIGMFTSVQLEALGRYLNEAYPDQDVFPVRTALTTDTWYEAEQHHTHKQDTQRAFACKDACNSVDLVLRYLEHA